MSLLAMLKPRGANGFGYGSTAEAVTAGLSLAGQTILVTGCNSGLGLETMRVLALRGAHVVGTARTLDKARAAGAMVGGQTTPMACELSEPASVLACVEAVRALGKPLDAIICNAGIMALPRLELAHGTELQFFTNHVGHFMLVTGLLASLAERGRVVMLSSAAHGMAPREGIQFENLDGAQGYTPWQAYGQSKLANLLFAKELGRRLAGTQQTANAVHPGVIQTNLSRSMHPVARVTFGLAGPLFLKTIPQGAATQCYVATHPDAATSRGAYFADCNPAASRADADDPALAQRLWEVTERLVAKLHAVRP